MRRIVMACAAGATLVVGACASETTEPKTPAQAAEEPAFDNGSGLSDEEFWAREEAKEAAKEKAEGDDAEGESYASDEEGADEDDSDG